jgi:hypothetical protein
MHGFYYEKINTTKTSVGWGAAKRFNFPAFRLLLWNKSKCDTVEWSFDGINVHGELSPGESIAFDGLNQKQIYFRSPSGAQWVRVWAWKGGE